MVIWDENNEKILQIEFSNKITKYILDNNGDHLWVLENINIPNINDINNKALEVGSAKCKYNSSKKIFKV